MKTNEEMISSVFERKHKYEAQKEIKRKRMIKLTSSLGTVCLALTVVIVGFAMLGRNDEDPGDEHNEEGNYVEKYEGAYKIMLDVNPSIEIRANGNDKVLDVIALNGDGAEIIGDRDFEGESTEEAVEKLTDSMVDMGYISEEANSVLVSVEGTDKDKNDKIGAEIADKISTILESVNVEGSIIVQSLDENDTSLENASGEYGISPGKAKLIAQIIAQNSIHTYEELSAMTVHELNLLRTAYYIDMGDSQVRGTPSALAYIGETGAADVAFSASGVSGVASEIFLECYRGVMNYRVEFDAAEHEYRYRINAVTGEILSEEKVEIGGKGFFEGDKEVATVGENAALSAALEHAGVNNAKLIRCKYKTDWVDGTVIYDIYFTDGRVSCKYVVEARTGDIIKYSKTEEYKDRSVSEALIGEAAAKQTALANYGIIDGSITKYEMVLKLDGGSYIYDIFYICNATKYEIEIDAADGAVISSQKTDLRDTGVPSVETGDKKSDEE